MENQAPPPDPEALVELFYSDKNLFGTYVEQAEFDLTKTARQLLAHNHHMTVTVEEYHGSLVDVKVLETRTNDRFYSRKILLTRQSDDRVVQFGIVRLDLESIDALVRDEILSQQTPLGRILIQHDVLRRVELSSLWKITAGEDLSTCCEVPVGHNLFGRTAWIYCNGKPAVELLEVVTDS